MKRVCLPLALAALVAVAATSPSGAQSCSIGGHDETSENFASAAGWATPPANPGSVAAGVSANHLVISEVAPRGISITAGSDSSEYVEIYNPTTRPVDLGDKYISDDSGYHRIVNGTYNVASTTDWALKFPAGLVLSPGRTLVLCVTKAGYFASGGTPGGAQHFLEMANSNANPSDDMVIMTPNTVFAVTGGLFTNPSNTNGEWVMLYCWNGASDLVCDIDYASYGANSASNPKVNKTGLSIDGPDAGAVASAFNPDTPVASQSNLGSGTVLTKPNTYQRNGLEVGEVTIGGNGCIGRVVPSAIDWAPFTNSLGEPAVRFHIRWQNPDDDSPSTQFTGTISSQHFGVFLPDYGTIGSFNVPPLQPDSFFDVFVEIPLSALPPTAEKVYGQGGPAAARVGGPATNVACPPDSNWAGNVDIIWSGNGQNGQVNKHYGDLHTCPGGTPSRIHVKYTNCALAMPWSVIVPCPGWTVTLVNEDLSPAPNPVPAGWTGWIQVTAAAGVPSGTNCCFQVVFMCDGVPGVIDVCSIACDCATAVAPTLTAVDWTTTGTTVTFHQHWENPSSTQTTVPVSGDMNSQPFGVFLQDFGPIGHFDVPPIAPSSFFDVFFDVELSALPPEPVIQLPSGIQCFPKQWHGNVDINWTSPQGPGNVNKHFGEMPVCAGDTTYLFVETDCQSPTGATWSIVGLCPGFTATLVNTDHTPAPNPVPPGWIGLIAVTAAPGTPIGTVCCFKVRFLCGTQPGVIDVCAKVCNCNPVKPVLTSTDWTKVGSNIRFHLRWRNPNTTQPSAPVSGEMNSQPFGVFLPDFGPIGQFEVPPIQPSSFFDVFMDIPLAALPPEPEERLPGGGPAPGSPCPEDTSWSGNVDIMWSGEGGSGIVGRHFTSLLVRPGTGSSHVHALIFCTTAPGATWSIAGLCPGWNATLLNEDFTPAPNPVPPNWTGWISVAAAGSVPVGSSCCFTVTFVCDGEPGVIDVCAEACAWQNSGVLPNPAGVDFGIYSTTPNPTRSGMSIGYAMPKRGDATLEIYNLAGQRIRTLLDGPAEAGMNVVKWDGRGENGRKLAPGAYFVTFRSGERVTSKKIVVFN